MHARAMPTWLFDLDNTLHDAMPYIFPQVNRAMTEYVRAHVGCDEDEANRLRETYWNRYGATMLGLVRHHDADPRHFLRETHRFADLPRMIVYERGVKAMLRRLPGKKLLFSNAPLHYTEAVLAEIDIAHLFSAVYSVERLRFQPKPLLSGFRRVLKNEKLDPRRCVMVEDSPANLKAAKQLGMKTVWVSASTRRPPYVDVKIASILDLPHRLGRL